MINVIKNKKGSMLVTAMVVTSLFIIIFFGAISLALMQQKLNMKKISSTQALHIAEAGVNYYRWVLYHDHEEYCNGETCLTPGAGYPDYGPYGPFTYTDQSGTITGEYVLYITPPPTNGSTMVDVKAIGWTTSNPKIKRTIEVKIGIPSWSSYSTLCNEFIRFGTGTETWGKMHSNGGIRFDGLAHNIVTSSFYEYDDPDHTGGDEFGVHTHVSPTDPLPIGSPPTNLPTRTDVFEAGRELNVPVISFDLLDSHIASMLAKANTDGIVLNNTGQEGYHLILSPLAGEGNDTIDVYIVTSDTGNCGNDENGIGSETFSHQITTPANGIIYIKDKTWIEGQIDGDRITIIASEDLSNTTDIIINKNLVYTNYDGTDAIGLIAERNFSIGLDSNDTLLIDAAIIAKEGRIGRNYYGSSCGAEHKRHRITITGSLATKNRYGFAYTDGTGYDIRELYYDANLTFAPPPHFPTTDEYTFISWKEN